MVWYTAVMPQAGTYAIKADGTRVTVPEGFFRPDSNPLPYRINPVDPRTQVHQPAPTPIPPAGSTPLSQQPTPVQNYGSGMNITDIAAQRLSAPSLPSGGQVVGQGISQEAGQYLDTTQGQVIRCYSSTNYTSYNYSSTDGYTNRCCYYDS